MEKSKTRIVIIDDLMRRNHPMKVKLEQEFEEVKIFSKAEDGLKYISDNINSKIILILDIKLSNGENGYETLEKLRGISYLIPVIIWTAINENDASFFKLINLKTYAIREQETNNDDMVNLVKEADADSKYSLSSAFENWLSSQNVDHNKPYMINTDGESYSINDIIKEVRKGSPEGNRFTQQLANLTIELLTKGKR